MSSAPLFMTAEELAREADCTVERVEELARAGIIPGVKWGRSWRFVRGDAPAFLAEIAREEAMQRRSSKQTRPEPAFRLTWCEGAYRVSKPNVEEADCYTEAQLRQVRREALEEAARVCEKEAAFSKAGDACSAFLRCRCAEESIRAIRALAAKEGER